MARVKAGWVGRRWLMPLAVLLLLVLVVPAIPGSAASGNCGVLDGKYDVGTLSWVGGTQAPGISILSATGQKVVFQVDAANVKDFDGKPILARASGPDGIQIGFAANNRVSGYFATTQVGGQDHDAERPNYTSDWGQVVAGRQSVNYGRAGPADFN